MVDPESMTAGQRGAIAAGAAFLAVSTTSVALGTGVTAALAVGAATAAALGATVAVLRRALDRQ